MYLTEKIHLFNRITFFQNKKCVKRREEGGWIKEYINVESLEINYIGQKDKFGLDVLPGI